MNLYLANGRYVGTQAEARRADRNFTPVAVPVDKDGLIAYLNKLARPPAPSSAAPAPHSAAEHPIPPALDPHGTIALVASCDGGATVQKTVDLICAASGYSLARYASAVAVAFQNIAKGN